MTDQRAPRRAVLRPSPMILIFALLLVFCASPLALSRPPLAVLYLLPLAITAWVLRTKTIVDASGIKVRSLTQHRTLPWEAIAGLALDRRSRVRAVLHDGGRAVLPSVRTRHLPALAKVSEGRITDPTEDTGGATGGATDSANEPAPAEDTVSAGADHAGADEAGADEAGADDSVVGEAAAEEAADGSRRE